jgi:hypothetical protein
LSIPVTVLAPQGVLTATGSSVFAAAIALKQSDPRLRWGQTVRVEFGA